MVQELSFEYLAGFMDGNGSIRVDRRKSRRGEDSFLAVIEVCNTNKDFIERLRSKFGGTLTHVGIKEEIKHGWKAAWVWRLHGRKGVFFIENILPYLNLKIEQAKLYLCFAETITEKSIGKNYILPDHINEERRMIFDECNILNKR